MPFTPDAPAPAASPSLIPPSQPVQAKSGFTPDAKAGAAPKAPPPPAKPGSGPLDAFKPVLGGAARAVGTGVGNVIDVLQRPQHMTAAAITGGPSKANTLVHGQSEASADQTRAELRQKFGITPFYDSLAKVEWTSPNGNVIPGHAVQGMIDFAIDTGTDPLTYLGGLGIIDAATARMGLKSATALAKGVNAAERTGTTPGRLAGQAYEFATVKGPALRGLIERNGEQGIAQHQGLRMINNARRTMQDDLGNTLVNQYRKVTQGLTEAEEHELYQAVHEGTTAQLPSKLGMRAAAFKRVTDSLAHLSGDQKLQEELRRAESPNLFRYQATSGQPEVSPRGGTFFSKDKPNATYTAEAGLGGKHLTSAVASAKNPLKVTGPYQDFGAGLGGVMEMRGPKSLRMIDNIVDQSTGKLRPENARKYLQALGVPKLEIEHLLSVSDDPEWAYHVYDRIASAMAQKRGFDAIETEREFFALHPESFRAPKPGGFQVGPEFQRFEGEQPRGMQMPEQYRQHYVPTAHDVSKFSQAQQAAGGITSLDPHAGVAQAESLEDVLKTHVASPEPATAKMSAEDQALKERGERAKLLAPELQRKVIEARLRGGASAIAARDAEQAAARLFGVKDFSKIPPEAKAFFVEAYTRPEDRSALQNIGHILKGAVDIPKHGLFALPFRHMMNIGFLSFLADPSLSNVTGTAGKFARLMLERSPEARAKILGKSLKYGVTGAPSIDRSPGWTGRIPILGEIYKASNHTLWTFDDAAKATRFGKLLKRYQRGGMAEPEAAAKAANDVGAEMVNYGERSPLTQALAYLLPFATWRTKMPGAIARATLKHPERPLALSRISPEITGDLQQGPPGSGKVGVAYTPMADAYRGVDNPYEFARAAAGWPLQMALAKAQQAGGQGNNYWSYYKEPNTQYALNETVGSFPGGDYLLRFPELFGKPPLTEFKDQGQPTSILPNLVRAQTGFGLKSGPSPRELAAKQHFDQQRAMIDSLRKQGYNAYADTLQKKLDTYMRYNPLFQK